MLNNHTSDSEASSECIILAVDDDSAVLSSLTFALEIDGFKVRAFATPAELLAVRDLPTAGCLVVDYRLPGMNGLALLNVLRGRGSTLPAILISAGLNEEIRRQAHRAGVSVIEKPLLANQLSQAIRRLLNASEVLQVG